MITHCWDYSRQEEKEDCDSSVCPGMAARSTGVGNGSDS